MKNKLTKLMILILSLICVICFALACAPENAPDNGEEEQTPQHVHIYVNNICECGEYDPTYYTDGLVFSVFGNGYSVEIYKGEATDVVIPSIYKGKPVINIGGNDTTLILNFSASPRAFSHCMLLKNIVIPNSVSTICSNAFMYCNKLNFNEENGLKYLGNPQNPYLFLAEAGDNDVSTVEINSQCKIISAYAFERRTVLTDLEIPNGVISVGSGAFSWCTSLKNVTIPNSVEFFGEDPFNKCNMIVYKEENGLKYLGNSQNPYLYLAGVVDDKMVTAEINSKCKIIGSRAFSTVGMSLTNVVIPNGLTGIMSGAFANCQMLEKICIPNSVTIIGSESFYYCNKLKSVEIPDNVTNVGFGAFMNCDALSNVDFGISEILIDHYAFAYCSSLENILIPSNIVGIGKSAFFGCKNLMIKCEAEEKPIDWNSLWNESECPVVWGYKG